MRSKKQPRRPAAAPVVPQPPSKPAPAWIKSVGQSQRIFDGLYSPMARRLGEIGAGYGGGRCVIPSWQREPCWSPEQQRGYVAAVMKTLLPSPIILQQVRGTRDLLVIDGQQRLTALGLIPGRQTAARIDVLTGEWSDSGWSVGEIVRWAEVGAWDAMTAGESHSEEQDAAIRAGGQLRMLELMVQIFDSSVTPQKVADVIRAVAMPGVIPTQAEVERMVAGLLGGHRAHPAREARGE